MAKTKKAAPQTEAAETVETEAEQVETEVKTEAPQTEDGSFPYTATVNVALAVVRKAVGPGTAEQLKPVGTIKQGTKVTIVGHSGGYARLANGLWIGESFLAR